MELDVSSGDALFARLSKRRGPMPGIGMGRGPGRPWAGIVEESKALWVTWLTDYWRRMGRPTPKGIMVDGQHVPIVGVKLTFGMRYFFQCPECARRCETLYFAGRRVACRKCLHLGYRSQASRPTSAWAFIDRLLSRAALRGPARWCPQGLEWLGEELERYLKQRLDEVLSRIGGVGDGDERSGEGGPARGPEAATGGPADPARAYDGGH